jgi:hypothetical protein
MADDIQNIGPVTAHWHRSPNWIKPMKLGARLSAQIVRYIGTPDFLVAENKEAPRRLQMTFANPDKAKEKELLDFFLSQKARLHKFWLPSWQEDFVLAKNYLANSAYLEVKYNYFDYARRGYERIMLLLHGGDKIVRKISSATRHGDVIRLGLATAIPRDILPSEVTLFSFYLLCRFDSDSLKIRHTTAHYSSVVAEFYELVREYPK